jgi:hypothetical protein
VRGYSRAGRATRPRSISLGQSHELRQILTSKALHPCSRWMTGIEPEPICNLDVPPSTGPMTKIEQLIAAVKLEHPERSEDQILADLLVCQLGRSEG